MIRDAALAVRPLGYTAMRMLRLRAALTDFLRRWGIYLVVVVVLFSAGTNAPFAIAASLAAMTVWPLRDAAAHGAVLVPTTAAYAVVGTLPVILTRSLWWPRRWAVAERALPLPADVIERSDRLFAALLMAPWQGVLVLGVGAWFRDGATSGRWWALAAWLLSACGSLRLSILWMRSVRRAGAGARVGRVVGAGSRSGTKRPAVRRVGVVAALIVLPMRRGQARRSALASIVGPLVTIACAIVPVRAGWSVDWAFAFIACAALCNTSVLRTSTIDELRPSWSDSRQLPLDPRACERARLAVTLLPLGTCALAGLVAVLLTPSPVRPQVCALYGLVVAAGCVLEALTPPQTPPSDHAARWLLMLVAALAFASEISPS